MPSHRPIKLVLAPGSTVMLERDLVSFSSVLWALLTHKWKLWLKESPSNQDSDIKLCSHVLWGSTINDLGVEEEENSQMNFLSPPVQVARARWALMRRLLSVCLSYFFGHQKSADAL